MADSINSKAKEYYDNDDSGGSLNNNLKDFLKQQGATGNSINTLWRSYAYGEGGNSLNTRLGKLWGTSGSLMKRWQDVLGLIWDEVKAFFNFRDTDPDFLLDGSTSFDGSNDYIDLGSDSSLDNIFDGGGTVSAWIYTNSDGEGDVGRVFNKRVGGEGWILFVHNESGSNVDLRFYNEFSTTDGIWDITIPIKQWNHIVISYDNGSVSNNPVMYLNGTSQSVTEAQTPVGTRLTDAGQNLYVGNISDGSATFDGKMANIGIWDRAISASEVESIYWRGSHSELKDTELTNLVSWYDLSSEALGGELVDDIINASNWNAFGSTQIAVVDGSIQVTYVDNALGAFNYLVDSKGLTIDPTQNAKYKLTVDAKITGGTTTNKKLALNDGSSISLSSNLTTSYASYEFIFTKGSSNPYIYFDNLSSSNVVNLKNFSVKPYNANDSQGSNEGLIVGATTNTDSYSGESPFKPRIQDKANPKMAVQLASGSTDFSGSSQYISIPDSNDLSFGDGSSDSAFSISAWVKMNDASNSNRITKGLESDNEAEWFFGNSGDKLYWYTFDESATAYVGRLYNTDITSYENQWIHICGTYSGNGATSGFKIYINGSRVDDTNFQNGTYTAMENLGADVHIGKYATGYHNGSMANVAIHSRELTQSQVQELMFTEKYSGLRTDLGSELVTNGDMESGDPPSNFSATQSTLDKETTIKHGGSSSLSITHTGGNGMAYQDVTVVSGETYQAKAWVYIASSSAVSNVRMWVNSTAGIGSDLSGDSVITTTKDTWVELTLIFTATTTLARIQIRLDQDGEVFADDISLQKLGEDDTRQGLVSWYDLGSTNVGSEINTLSNASSPTNETNATTGWTNANYETFNSQTEGSEPSGSFSIYLSGSSDKYAHESFTVKVGVVYSIEIVYKTVGNVNVLIGTGEAGNEYSGNIRNKADWFTDTQSITATGTSLFISFQNVGVAQIYVDTLSIKESAIIADNQGSNNGSIYGATTTTGYTSSPHGVVDPLNYGEVYSGRALDFDGTNDYVSVPDDNSLSFGDGSNDSAMSISAWIKTDDVTDFEIVSKGVYSTSGEYRFLISSNDSLYLSLYNGNDSLYEIAYTTSTLKAHEGQWTHVVCTYNGVGGTSANTGIKLYVNGTSQSLTLLSYGSYDAMENSSTDLMIGRHSSAYSEGLINNLKIFSAELTQAQIQQLFTAPETVLPTGVSASNLKLDLPMQEGSGSYIYDGSIRVGSELVVNGDMELDSNWGDVVDPAINERSTEIVRTGTYSRKIVGDSSYDGMAQAITVVAGESYLVSGWVYGDGTNKLYARAYDGGGSGYDNFWIGSSNDGIVVPAEWTYYEKIFKAVGTTFTIQILQGDTSAGGVTFYADDISLKNVTGGQNHGTISGATWATGQEYGYQSSLVRSNTPMIFDGSDDYVSIADSSSFDPGTGDFSLSLWFNNTGNDGAVNTLVFRRADSGTYDGWNAYIATDGTPRFQLDGDAQVNISATGDVGADGKWHHYLVSCDRSGNADVYIDGSLNVSADITSANNSINVTAPIYIGQNNGNSARFAGLINEFAIWDVALDADAVTALYGSGTPLLPTSDSGNYDNSDDLQGYWRNDGNTTWTDRSTNSNNGTVSDTSVASIVIPEGSTSDRDSQGFLLSDTTSITNGIRLHGSEHISIQDSEVLSFGDGTDDKPFSIEAWIKMDDAKNFAILSKGAYGSDGEYYFAVNSSDKLFFELYDDSVSSTWETAMYNTALTSYKGQWIHVCGTYDGRGGTSANAGVKLYLNGSSVATTLSDGGTYVAMENLSQSINIGKRQTSMADGLIDEVRIYSKELSASEVTKNYNNGKSAHQ